MRLWLGPLALLLVAGAADGDWIFGTPFDVSGDTAPGTFFHLESAGRRNLAIGEGHVGIVWEDNRQGTPRVYLATKPSGPEPFGAPQAVSGGAEAYEPAIAAIEGGFLVGWEEHGQVRLRVYSSGGLGPVLTLDPEPSAQLTLGPDEGGGAYAAWVRHADGHGRIMAAQIVVDGEGLRIRWQRPVETTPPEADQLYPSLVAGGAGLVVGWEDRRHGHTRLYTAALGAEGFGAPRQLNELPPPRSTSYGRGTGVTRLALAGAGDRVAAAWMDKRDFQGGYDIYAAVSSDGGLTFGSNELVQDLFGENQPQWHPAVAVSAQGLVVVVWDDPRDGSPDLWMSWRRAGQWSDDAPIPGAQGPGAQDNPAIGFDTDGRVHIAWVDRDERGSRIRYTTASWTEMP